jgi:hypothetical protein
MFVNPAGKGRPTHNMKKVYQALGLAVLLLLLINAATA